MHNLKYGSGKKCICLSPEVPSICSLHASPSSVHPYSPSWSCRRAPWTWADLSYWLRLTTSSTSISFSPDRTSLLALDGAGDLHVALACRCHCLKCNWICYWIMLIGIFYTTHIVWKLWWMHSGSSLSAQVLWLALETAMGPAWDIVD